jgi:hypothetical protein
MNIVFYVSICSLLVVFKDVNEKPNGRWNKVGIASTLKPSNMT